MGSFGPWPARVAWGALPFAAGAALADALESASDAVRWVAAVELWGAWAVVLVATLVPRTVSLTTVRAAAPAALAAVAWAAIRGPAGVDDAVALGWAVLTVVVTLAAATADAFVDGSSWGPERRFSLRTPVPVLVGPVPVVWLATAAAAAAGPLLLAARQWVPGALLVAVGAPVVVGALRRLHQLSRRWVVFVPAGFVLHDPLGLIEPMLFRKRTVAQLGPATLSDGSEGRDLSGGAPGLTLALRLTGPVDLNVRRGRRGAETVSSALLLFTPGRPGAVLREARDRGLPVG